jgi:ATP/maltotriose-dependent transcriptional regulator MalT
MLREIQHVGPAHDRREARIWVVAAYIWGPAPVEEGLAYMATVRDQPRQTLRSSAILQACEAALLAAAGRIGPASELARASALKARELDPLAFGDIAQFRARVPLARGDLDDAVRTFTEAIEVMREHGDLSLASSTLSWKTALLLERGDHDDQARQVLDEPAAVTSPYDNASVGLVASWRAVLAARHGDLRRLRRGRRRR